MDQQNVSAVFTRLKSKFCLLSIQKYATLLAALFVILNATPLSARPISATPATPALSVQGPLDVKEFETFMDQLVEQNLREYQIPGATVSVVKDGSLFFAKGYGLADIEKQIAVDAERTLFQIGSTSKLFTWTAVMQLVEQGKLDLDQDVNTYLHEFQIPATFPQPITLRHLMTHTAGFEERQTGAYAKVAGTILSLQDYLTQYVPARVRPPGQLTAYSNYGTALAGYIVSVVSRMPFEVYVEENIYRPLGMMRSTFRQPLPAKLAGDLATGYSVANGSLVPEPHEFLNVGPAGSMCSTALDMARFMIAHLQDGRYSDAGIADARILQTATAQQMHQRQFANDPRLNGFTLGFFDLLQNQQHILEHGGGTINFHTQLVLLPEQNMGIFISYNGSKGITAVEETLQAYLDHYYPVMKLSPVESMPGFAERADRYTGEYRWTRFNYAKIDRIFSLSGEGFGRISANSDGTLAVAFELPRKTITGTFIEVSPMVFQEVDGTERLVFKEDSNGRIATLLINSTPHFAYEKISWYETAWLSLRLIVICLAVFLSVLLAFLGDLVWTHRKPDLPRLAALCTSLLALFLGTGYLLNNPSLVYGASSTIKFLQGSSLVMPLLAGMLVVLVIFAWVRGMWGWVARVHYSLVAMAAVGFVWFLNAWNLLGFRL